MKRYAYAWLLSGLVLATPKTAPAQEPSRSDQVELLQNYPNPFNPATTIPFRLRESLFRDGRRPVVSLRIYNVLAQLVAIPSIQASGEPLNGVALECREPRNGVCEFSAYWDGRYLNSDREVASGIYVYQLVVNGRRTTRKMIVMK
ncbi:MAG: hypothetical protein HY705_09120 [Gemmatimonadetes bacterium]|nr:hypothetical protein [Gemmatimonadota bacterium]